MIRFIDLGKQIGGTDDWPREFAFFNTITDRFETFGAEQVFESKKDFELVDLYPEKRKRFIDMIPADWPK